MNNRTRLEKIAFLASAKPDAQKALKLLQTKYGKIDEKDANVIVAIGGDGLMLEALRKHMDDGIPIFGLNQGTIGFLMNDYSEDNLIERLINTNANIIHPLKMEAIDVFGNKHVEYAINEVSLIRQTHQAAKLTIKIDKKERLPELICDGIILSTSAGSTAYNLSAHGPILPINSGMLALTPLSAFRPRRWRGAILRDTSKITIQIKDASLRPVSVSADNIEFRDIKEVNITLDVSKSMILLFDENRSLDDRVLAEQFAY